MCGAGSGVWSSEMTHQPPAVACIAQGRPGVRYARRGVPHKERWVEVCRLLTVVSRAVWEKRVSSWRCGEAGAPTLHSCPQPRSDGFPGLTQAGWGPLPGKLWTVCSQRSLLGRLTPSKTPDSLLILGGSGFVVQICLIEGK